MELGDERLPKRFWEKVQLGAGGCWIWTAGRTSHGYARYKCTKTDGVRIRLAHVVTALLERGPKSEGDTCSHLCHITACVNPSHIVYESLSANILRSKRSKTVCKNGHKRSAWGMLFVSSRDPSRSWLKCRICHYAKTERRKPKIDQETGEELDPRPIQESPLFDPVVPQGPDAGGR